MPGLSVDVSTLAGIFILVGTLTLLERVTGELFTQIGVDELGLRVLVVTEDDLGCMPLSRVVDSETAEFCQNAACGKVGLSVFEHCLGGDDVIRAVLDHTIPVLLVHRVVP